MPANDPRLDPCIPPIPRPPTMDSPLSSAQKTGVQGSRVGNVPGLVVVAIFAARGDQHVESESDPNLSRGTGQRRRSAGGNPDLDLGPLGTVLGPYLILYPRLYTVIGALETPRLL